jgi:hypothetical protein
MSDDQKAGPDDLRELVYEVLGIFDQVKRQDPGVTATAKFKERLITIEVLARKLPAPIDQRENEDCRSSIEENIKRLRYNLHRWDVLRADLAHQRPELGSSPDQPSTSIQPQTSIRPPNGACFLLDLFLAKADREIRGDLEEEFATSILPRYGARRARSWFWTQAVGTIATRNPICRWIVVSGLARLGEWIFRQIGT